MATETNTAEVTAIICDPKLNKWDRIVLENIGSDADEDRDRNDLEALKALNDPKHEAFEPTVFVSIDLDTLPLFMRLWLLQPYIGLARSLVRVDTDVVMASNQDLIPEV